jgi:polyhydroxybutyrate depolymerase
MRRSAFLFVMLCAACTHERAFVCGDDGRTDPECHGLSSGGATRVYLLHVPAQYHAGGSLVIALHGTNELGPRFRDVSQLSATADAQGFAIAYPNALPGFDAWNVYFSRTADMPPPDDIAFLRELITSLTAQLAPDPRRVYVVGLSNGGIMAHRVAVELSDLVAAVADVAGTLATSQALVNVPSPANGVSVLMLHGDSDVIVPCCTFKGAATLDDSFDYWASTRANACAAVSTSAPICEAPETSSSLASKRASGCRDGAEVQFYKLFRGRHGWYQGSLTDPDAEGYNPLFADSIGVTMNEVIWHWFETHPKQS